MRAADLNDLSFTVLMEHVEIDHEAGIVHHCWCQVPATRVIGVHFEPECDTTRASRTLPVPDLCNGALYLFDPESLQRALSRERDLRYQESPLGHLDLRLVVRFKVLVHGDLIRDLKDRALDANHLPPWLAVGTGTVTGDGIAGGLFESWFSVSLEGN